jgi:hypothetical protein
VPPLCEYRTSEKNIVMTRPAGQPAGTANRAPPAVFWPNSQTWTVNGSVPLLSTISVTDTALFSCSCRIGGTICLARVAFGYWSQTFAGSHRGWGANDAVAHGTSHALPGLETAVFGC